MVSSSSLSLIRNWYVVGLIYLIILSSLIWAEPLLGFLGNQNIQAALFLMGMFLVGTTIISYAFLRSPTRREWVRIIGFSAIFVMLFLRLGLAERSHLIEYGVLAVCIHRAASATYTTVYPPWKIALHSVIMTAVLGLIDEGIQWFLPKRVFAWEDVIFNTSSAILAVFVKYMFFILRRRS